MGVSWFIGSITFTADQAFTTSDGPGTLSAGTYFLRSATAAESLLDAFETALDVSAGVDNPAVFMDESGHVQMTGTGFSVTWGSATELRDALGFTGNLGSSASHTATAHSNIGWFPRFPADSQTRQGIDAYEDPDIAMTMSPTGQTVVTTEHHRIMRQRFSFGFVYADQLQDARPSSPGTFHRFLEDVLRVNRSFLHYPQIEEVIGSTAAVSWTTGQGAYRVADLNSLVNWYSRKFQYNEVGGPISFAAVITDEV